MGPGGEEKSSPHFKVMMNRLRLDAGMNLRTFATVCLLLNYLVLVLGAHHYNTQVTGLVNKSK